MTKIKNYPIDSNITDNDKLIGSDGDNGNITKNFTLSSLSSYFNSDLIDYINNIIGIGSTGSRLINPSYFNIPGTLQYIVQADAYIINGTFYNMPVNDTVTLNASDATNNRFDVIVVNTDGSVTSITGVPSTSPAVPIINDETQVTVTKVLVEANATAPSGVTTTLVFDENTQVLGGEWDTTASPSLTIDLESSEQAENGMTSARFAVESSDNYILFEDDSTHNGSDLSTIRFGIYIKKPDDYRFSVRIVDVSDNAAPGIFFESGQYGFNNTVLDEWQIITIPANAFEGISSIVYDKIQFGNEGSNSEPFYFDFLQIQEGLTPVASGIPNYTLNLINTELQLLKDGLVNSTVDLSTPTLQDITDEGNVTTNDIQLNGNAKLRIQDVLNVAEFAVFDFITSVIRISKSVGQSFFGIQDNFFEFRGDTGGVARIYSNLLSATREYTLPNKNGTFAMLDDIPTGFVRYDGAESFSNSTEITVNSGSSASMIDTDPVPVVSFSGLDVYFTIPPAPKPTFNFSAINQVYVLTVVFKARSSNTNAAHIELNFNVSGNTSYTRLSKSVDFYKGNDEIQNFHEVFQFYTDQDLVDNGMSLSLNAVGATVKFGDVIYFIQRCI